MIEIKCTPQQQILIKRSIKANECNSLCEYKPMCSKLKGLTCGEYIMSMIRWELTGDNQTEIRKTPTMGWLCPGESKSSREILRT